MQLNALMSCFPVITVLAPLALAIAPSADETSVNLFPIQRRSIDENAPRSAFHRRLIAARPPSGSDISREVVPAFLKHDHVLHFIEDESLWGQEGMSQSQSRFAAHVRLSSHLPALLLEDNDAHFEHVECSASTIIITFYNADAVSTAWRELEGHPELLIITSHLDCNPVGERKPFLVSNIKRGAKSLLISVATTSWRKSFHSIDVDFGSREGNSFIEYNDALQRRELVATTTATSPKQNLAYSRSSSQSASPTQSSVQGAGLSMSYINTTILPPNFSGINNTILQAPTVPLGFTFGCKNCTLSGSADLTSGKFSVAAPLNITNLGEKIKDAFDPGYIKLAVSLSAYIELENTILGGDHLSTFTAPIPDITILAFEIPGIAEVAPVLRPNINIGVQSPKSLNFTYGFRLDIPSNSSIVLNIGDLSNSSITGFQQTHIAALPFQSNHDDLNLTIQAAFNPQILFVLSLFDNDLSLEAGGFLDLPMVQVTVAKVKHVDKKCNLVNATSHLEDHLFDSLTNVSPSVEIDVGVLAAAHASIGNLHSEPGLTRTLGSTIYPLPTVCYSFDAKGQAYVTPTPASTASATATNGLGPKSDATNGLGSKSDATNGLGSKSDANSFRPLITVPSVFSSFIIVLFYWVFYAA